MFQLNLELSWIVLFLEDLLDVPDLDDVVLADGEDDVPGLVVVHAAHHLPVQYVVSPIDEGLSG